MNTPVRTKLSTNIVWQPQKIHKIHRENLNKHKGAVLWFTGLSGSGKSTIAQALEEWLYKHDYHSFILDGDNIRHGLCNDLGFNSTDRTENIRRIGEVSKLFLEAGLIVLVAFISPYRKDRENIKDIIKRENFIEIYCNTPLKICENRDIKGLYEKARRGEIPEFTGISSPYEPPTDPDIILDTSQITLDICRCLSR